MNIKILIQLLLFIILISTATTYYYFYKNNKTNVNVDKINSDDEISVSGNSSNVIKNISYTSTDNMGNKFKIKSERGEINFDDTNMVYMTNVEAVINLINSDPIIIKSNYANYNKTNYETNFKENVLVTYQIHKITSQNLDLSFQDNLATIYNKVVYDDRSVKLGADILKIDLITKNSKIFMYNEYKKIKVTNQK